MNSRAAWVLLAGVLGVAGCRSPVESKGAHADPRSAIKACRAVLKNKPPKLTAERVRAVVSACGKLLSEPACRKSWLVTYTTAASIEDMLRAQNKCLCAYCKRIKGQRLTFCSRYCKGGQFAALLVQKGTSPEEQSERRHEYFTLSRKLWNEIRHHEYGSQCSLHTEAAELLGQMSVEIQPYMLNKIMAMTPKPSEPPEPILPPDDEPGELSDFKPAELPDSEPLDLAVVMRDGGLYIKSRYGAECPAGAPVDKKLCFPTHGRLTSRVLKQLQHHLWYLFASKYDDPVFYKRPADKHTITLIPEPTIKYDDIVRLMDRIREIPRDARNAPPAGAISPGCVMTYNKKAGAWGFAKGSDGRSVGETVCMYYRITLALGSS